MTFDPQNHLERSLMRAAKDPAARPQFYRDLAESELYIIQHDAPPDQAEGTQTLAAGMSLRIAPVEIDGKEYLPVFSSLPRLQAVLTSEVGYIAINALEFMKITRGAELALNPGSEYGKIFTAAEIAGILDGGAGRERYVTERETPVMIGQPAKYPRELADALSRFFERRKEVSRAWIAHFFNPQQDEKPHTIVGVEAETEDWDTLSTDIGIVATGVEIPDPPLDVIAVSGRGGLDDYFLEQCEPFYQRKKKKTLGLF
ncbi:MAG TPA: enhanced serine sensitivity protein SseB C-terminal domain-containing protein [Gemmatimonadaceae bacterium]|nr:enhanced serine sensitivity protein SseB C-terminal domain-containing protein [Gemmatimonadaceae bacterium]